MSYEMTSERLKITSGECNSENKKNKIGEVVLGRQPPDASPPLRPSAIAKRPAIEQSYIIIIM